MNLLARLFGTLFRQKSQRRRIAEEIEFHIHERVRENMALGMRPGQARTKALRSFGNRSRLADEIRDTGVPFWFDSFMRDARLAVRSLEHRKGLTTTAILSLALAIGATSAIFSIVDAVILKPLPLPHADRLIRIFEIRNGDATADPHEGNPPRMNDWANQVPGLEAVAGSYGEDLTIEGDSQLERLSALRTCGRMLTVLGVRPILGRAFTQDEEASEGEPVALVSYGLWQRHFGRDLNILGRRLQLSGSAFTIIGVLPPELTYPQGTELLIPAPSDIQHVSRRAGFLKVIGRIKPDATLQSVQTELDTVSARLAQQYPDTDSQRTSRIVSLQDDEVQDARSPLLLLFATTALVLLIACVNITGLLMSRAGERQREAAIRMSLGAGRSSLVRLYLMESLMLAVAGGALGLLVAQLSLKSLVHLLPSTLPRWNHITLDWRVVFFGAAVSLLCGLFFGIAPAWSVSQSTDRSRACARTTRKMRGRRVMVCAQVMLSVVLLASVGLLLKSLLVVISLPLGFQPNNVLTVKFSFPWNTPGAKLEQFYARVLDGFASIPGVRAVGVVDRLPLDGGAQSGPLAIRGRTLPADLEESQASFRLASPGYFTAIGIPLKRGRIFRKHAEQDNHFEAVINETFARVYFPESDAIGNYITFNPKPAKDQKQRWFEVVGIVGDVRMELKQREQIPEMFVFARDGHWPLASFALRAQGDPRMLVHAVREVVRRIDPNQIVDGISTMQETVAGRTGQDWIFVRALGGFASVALLLTAMGIYGLLASDVAQRTREIGVRIALGARPGTVARMFAGSGLLIAAAGLILGFASAAATGTLMASLLFGVQSVDPTIYAVDALVLLIIAAAASWFPARRAAHVDPMTALREE